jgi:hypothetical protein
VPRHSGEDGRSQKYMSPAHKLVVVRSGRLQE